MRIAPSAEQCIIAADCQAISEGWDRQHAVQVLAYLTPRTAALVLDEGLQFDMKPYLAFFKGITAKAL